MVGIEFATPLGLTDMDPVGSAVAGAAEAIYLNERFEKDGAVVVAAFPIRRKPFGESAKNTGSQVFGVDPSIRFNFLSIRHSLFINLSHLLNFSTSSLSPIAHSPLPIPLNYVF